MDNFISLSQAAKQFKISKGTISNAIKSGALPTKGKSSNGGYKIDIADFEVWRNHNYKNPRKTRFAEPNKTPSLNPDEPLKNNLLQAKLDVMTEQRDFYKNQFEKVEVEKNRFVDMLEKKDNLLTFYQKKDIEKAPEPVPEKPKTDLRLLWAFLGLLTIGLVGWYALIQQNGPTGLKMNFIDSIIGSTTQ